MESVLHHIVLPPAGSTNQPYGIECSTGSGQLFRNSCALSALTLRPIHLKGIRAKRPNPGIQEQHRCGLLLVQRVSQGAIEGNEIGSMEAKFTPREIMGGEYGVTIRTAGSISLLIQTILPVAAFSNTPITVRSSGGTDVDFSPTIDYMKHVIFPNLSRFGFRGDIDVIKRGFYPAGGGDVVVTLHPAPKLSAIEVVEPGEPSEIQIFIVVGGKAEPSVGEKMASISHRILKKHKARLDFNIQNQAGNFGYAITIVVKTSTGCIFGGCGSVSKKEQPEEVAEAVAKGVSRNIYNNISVDEWTQDQLIIFMALAFGTSRILTPPLTEHSETAMSLCREFLGVSFNVTPRDKDLVLLECTGASFLYPSLSTHPYKS